jgi:hypothetical protein
VGLYLLQFDGYQVIISLKRKMLSGDDVDHSAVISVVTARFFFFFFFFFLLLGLDS